MLLTRTLVLLTAILCCNHAAAQFDFVSPKSNDETVPGNTSYLGEPHTQIYRAGVKLEPGMNVGGVRLTIPVPQNWGEEQKVRLLDEKNETAFRTAFHPIGGVTLLELSAPTLRPLTPAEVVFTYEVTRRDILPPSPDEIANLVIPKKIPPVLEPLIKSESPKIEHKNKKFAQLFQEITAGIETDWAKVEAIYDYVRERLTYDDNYKDRNAKGALTTITDGKWCGDCKDMTFVFIAICRAGKIPARAVRLPTHCYAEFYLENPNKTDSKTTSSSRRAAPVGRWYPCELAGDRHFGSLTGISAAAPILQRGDNYTHIDLTGDSESMYYYKEMFEAAEVIGGARPKFTFIHAVVEK
ncbi:MAG: transglutaminase-like domain-containing protein [Thermoguttaceae bacterium]